MTLSTTLAACAFTSLLLLTYAAEEQISVEFQASDVSASIYTFTSQVGKFEPWTVEFTPRAVSGVTIEPGSLAVVIPVI